MFVVQKHSVGVFQTRLVPVLAALCIYILILLVLIAPLHLNFACNPANSGCQPLEKVKNLKYLGFELAKIFGLEQIIKVHTKLRVEIK